MERIAHLAKHVTASAGMGLQLHPQVTATSPILVALKQKIANLAKERSALKAELLKEGNTKIQEVTIEMAINGARSMKTMVTETSDLDAMKGIAYRGLSLYECNQKLPKAPGGECALPEAAFWLLLTERFQPRKRCGSLLQNYMLGALFHRVQWKLSTRSQKTCIQ